MSRKCDVRYRKEGLSGSSKTQTILVPPGRNPNRVPNQWVGSFKIVGRAHVCRVFFVFFFRLCIELRSFIFFFFFLITSKSMNARRIKEASTLGYKAEDAPRKDQIRISTLMICNSPSYGQKKKKKYARPAGTELEGASFWYQVHSFI